MAFTLCLTLSILIHLIHAINDTNISPTYTIAIESSKPYFSTTHNPSTAEYDTNYEIYVHYQYTAPVESETSTTYLGNVFAKSTKHAFHKYGVKIFDTKYCVVSTEYYNENGLCSYYEYQADDDEDTYTAYGTFLGKKSNVNDYDINDIYKLSEFRSILGDTMTRLVGYGSFTVISVDISVINIPVETEYDEILLLLDVIDIILYSQLYAFIAFCCLLMCVSKLYALYSKHDDIRFVYFIYFVVFSLNFFANSIIFVSRIFQQQHIILGAIAALFLFIVRSIFDISTTTKSKAIWIKPAFISKRVKEWYIGNGNIFIAVSLISGPIGSITFANSRLFFRDIFLMGIPKSMILHFVANLFWKILLLQRMPELAIQIAFVLLNGYDHYFLFALITTILSISLLFAVKLQQESIELNHEFFIEKTAFLMEISSAEINENSQKYLSQPNAFKSVIAEILEIDIKSIELPLFEAIKVSTESNCQNVKVFRCYGLKIHIAVNTVTMSRRVILMKLQDAQQNDYLVQKLKQVWDLEDEPSIDDIVMIYDLSGDIVIQRAVDEPRLSVEGEKNLQLLEDELLRQKAELYAIQKQEEEEALEKMSMAARNNPIEVSLNDSNSNLMYHHHHRKIKRRTPSKIHIADTSCTLDMQFNGDGIDEEDLALTLQRITSNSSIKSVVSL